MSPKHLMCYCYDLVKAINMQQINKIMETQDEPSQDMQMKEWNKIRQKYASPSQSLTEEKAVELILQWIASVSGQEFQRMEQQANMSIKQMIGKVMTKEKQSNYLLVQKYDFEMGKKIRDKVREKYKKTIQKQKQEKQEKQLIEQSRQESKKEEPSMNGSSLEQLQLPSLPPNKRKGKVYNPQQMAPYFQLNTESIQEYSPRHPHMFETKRKIEVSNKAKIFSNKYLKLAFQRFCKRAYNPKGLFGEFMMQADKMNLNKWMVFCKQFDFTDKIHSKHLLEVYQTATKFGSTMDLEQFLIAVGLLQQKYMQRFHSGQDFVEDVLKINSEAAFRIKMENLKVQYGGPTKNFFEYATYTQAQKKEQIEKEKQFKAKKKQRQIVLIKGMYEEHIRSEVQKRKEQRSFNKMSRSKVSALNKSSVINPQQTYSNRQHQSIPYSPPIHKAQIPTYSKLFNIKKHTAKKSTHSSLAGQHESHFQASKMPRGLQTTSIRQHPLQYSTVREEGSKKMVQEEPKREWVTDSGSPSIWMTRLRSDSQESDQILKEHLELQKKMKNKMSASTSPQWMKELQLQSQKVSEIQQQIEDQDMAETGANFKPREAWRPPY